MSDLINKYKILFENNDIHYTESTSNLYILCPFHNDTNLKDISEWCVLNQNNMSENELYKNMRLVDLLNFKIHEILEFMINN